MNFAHPASMRRLGGLMGATLIALSAFGCGAERGDVSGKVAYQGKPVVFGTVQFEAADGTLKQGNITKEGTYSIAGVPVGPVKAAVNSPDPNGTSRSRPEKLGQAAPPPKAEYPDWFPIPDEYQNLGNSQLSYTVKNGKNTIDIELK